MPPRDADVLSQNETVICDIEARVGHKKVAQGLDNYHGDRCLLKNKVYPLQKWSETPYGISYLMPKDITYKLFFF